MANVPMSDPAVPVPTTLPAGLKLFGYAGNENYSVPAELLGGSGGGSDAATEAAASASAAALSAATAAGFATGLFPSTAEGITATTSTTNKFFLVPGTGNTYATLYENVSGTATQRGLLPSLAAVTAVNDRASSVVRERIGVTNLFNVAEVVSGVLVGDGVETANGSFKATGFIPVEPGSVTFNIGNTFGGLYGAQFYSAAKTFIPSGQQTVRSGIPVTAPAGAAYVRTNFDAATNLAKLMVVSGSIFPAYFMPFGDPLALKNFNAIRQELEANTPQRLSLFDPAKRIPNKLLNEFNALVDAGNFYFVTNYMPVTPGGTFTTFPESLGLGAGYPVNYYDQNYGWLGVADLAPYAANKVHTVPAGAYYARMSVATTQLNSFVAVPGSVPVTNAYHHKLATVREANPWAGRNVAFLGDSIMAEGNWIANKLIPRLQMNLSLPSYASGRTLQEGLLGPDRSTPYVAADFANIDLVYIELGVNNSMTPTGSITDATGGTSFYSRYKTIIETQRGYNPAMRFILQTLSQYTNHFTAADATSGRTGADTSQAIRNIAQHYGFPVADMEKEAWGAGNLATMTYDGLHPSTAGIDYGLLPAMERFIRNVRPIAWP